MKPTIKTIMLIVIILLASIAVMVMLPSCSNPRKLQSDAVLLNTKNGTIMKHQTQAKLVKTERTMKGFKHYFLTDTSGYIIKFFDFPLKRDSCYLLYNYKITPS